MAGGAVAFLVSLEKCLLDRFLPAHRHPSHQQQASAQKT
jgi:hypothetical protein